MNTLLEIPKSADAERPTLTQQAARRYQRTKPGSAAEEEMVRQHLVLVKNVVGRLAMTLPAHVESEDLYSAGMVGLLDAVRHFDPCAGSSFESYARVRIRGAIIDELRRLDWVPRSVHDKARKVQAVIQQLEQEHGEAPSTAQIARAMQISLQECEQLLDDIRPATFVCLDSVAAHEDSEADRHDTLADSAQPDPSESAARNEMAEIIYERLSQLPDAQRKVLALYYFEDLRLREIAAVFGVTESRICQIHAQAIVTIRALVKQSEDCLALNEG